MVFPNRKNRNVTLSKISLSKGNHKLSKDILIWNLPSGKTCPGSSKECLEYCYAKKAERQYPGARASRERNYQLSLEKDFVESMIAHLSARKESVCRIHESGDFYSKEYYEKWIAIARRLPNMTFYSYSKSFVVFNMFEDLPDNFLVLQSYGSKDDSKIDSIHSTARVIESETDLLPGDALCGYYKKGHGKCGEECRLCMIPGAHRIVFKKH